jgi:phosphoglycerate dehydrogenase-like enzyme
MSKKLEVLILKHPQHMRDPWMSDVLEAIGTNYELREYNEQLPLGPQFDGVDVVIDQGGSHGTRQMADLCGSIKLWQVLGTGLDKLDLAYWRKKKIPVANTPGQFSAVPLAEVALMYILMLAHRWNDSQQNLAKGIFYMPFGEELVDKRLTLFGFGASAQALAVRARPFGMRISAVDIREISETQRKQFGLDFAGKPEDIDSLLPHTDFLSLHLHLNADTRGIVDARRIGLMKPTACIINVARGALVDETAMYNALRDGRLGGAGLDVFAAEPIDPNNPLLRLPNVIATNHTSGTTFGTSRRRAAVVAENLARIAQGLGALYRVDEIAEQVPAGKA